MGDTRVYDVVVLGFRLNAKSTPAQVLEDILGVEPAQARALVQAYPSTVIKRTTLVHAEIASEQLREAGARVEVVESERSRAVAAAASAGAVGVVASASGAKAQVATKVREPDVDAFGKAPESEVRAAPANNNARAPEKSDARSEEKPAKAERARALTLNVKTDDAPLEIETSRRSQVLLEEKSEPAPPVKAKAPQKQDRQRALTLNNQGDEDLRFELDKGFGQTEAQPELKSSDASPKPVQATAQAPLNDRAFALTFNLSQGQKPGDAGPAQTAPFQAEKQAKEQPSAKADAGGETGVSPEMLFDQARLREMAKSLESPELDDLFNGGSAAAIAPKPAAKDALSAKFDALDALDSKLDAKPGFGSSAFEGGPLGLGNAKAFGATPAPQPAADKTKAKVQERPGLPSADELFVPLAAVKEGKAPGQGNPVDKAASRVSQVDSFAKPKGAAKDPVEVQIYKPKKTGLQKAFESTAVKLSAAVATFAVVGSVAFATMTPKGAPKDGPIDETTAKAIEKYRGRALPNLNVALRFAPKAVRAPLAKILREQVQGAFLVEISWEDMPLDAQCFLVMKNDGKGNERETKLRETGVVLVPPEEETEVAFKEHEESLRLAHDTTGSAKFDHLCLSTNEYELMLLAQVPE